MCLPFKCLPTQPHTNICTQPCKEVLRILKPQLTTTESKNISFRGISPPLSLRWVLFQFCFLKFCIMMLKNFNAEKVSIVSTTIVSNSFCCSNSNGKHMVNTGNATFIVGTGRTDGHVSWISHPDIKTHETEISIEQQRLVKEFPCFTICLVASSDMQITSGKTKAKRKK